jgi:hypothetical protein
MDRAEARLRADLDRAGNLVQRGAKKRVKDGVANFLTASLTIRLRSAGFRMPAMTRAANS